MPSAYQIGEKCQCYMLVKGSLACTVIFALNKSSMLTGIHL